MLHLGGWKTPFWQRGEPCGQEHLDCTYQYCCWTIWVWESFRQGIQDHRFTEETTIYRWYNLLRNCEEDRLPFHHRAESSSVRTSPPTQDMEIMVVPVGHNSGEASPYHSQYRLIYALMIRSLISNLPPVSNDVSGGFEIRSWLWVMALRHGKVVRCTSTSTCQCGARETYDIVYTSWNDWDQQLKRCTLLTDE